MNPVIVHRRSAAQSDWGSGIATHRVLRNTYALLSLTLLFSAGSARCIDSSGPSV